MNKSFQVQKVETHFSKMSIDLFSIYFIAQCIEQKSAEQLVVKFCWKSVSRILLVKKFIQNESLFLTMYIKDAASHAKSHN